MILCLIRLWGWLSYFITNKRILGSIPSECVMRLVLVYLGIFLTFVSIPAYYYLPHILSDMTHSFIGSMSGGNMNSASMLRQMGYPSMHQVLPILGYSLIGMTVAGIGITMFGLVAKKATKARSAKQFTDESFTESNVDRKSLDSKIMNRAYKTKHDKVMIESVNDVRDRLEHELEELKKRYEDQ